MVITGDETFDWFFTAIMYVLMIGIPGILILTSINRS